MKNGGILIQVLAVISLLGGVNGGGPSDEELEVILQFFEFELEDICTLKSEAKWEFITGNKTDLKQLLELELKEGELYKNETQTLQESSGKTFFNKRLQRLFDIFSYPGAPLLGTTELREYKEYSIKLEEINRKMTIGCQKKEVIEDSTTSDKEEGCEPKNAREVNKILANEKDEKKLKQIWSEWFEELAVQNRKTKYDFMQQLSILDIEAEQNEEDDLSDYWLKQTDITQLDYHKISQLWKEIIPLYQKLRKYMASVLEQHYGPTIFIENKLFPMHVLGSLKPDNWITAAEKLGAFENAKPYKTLKRNLRGKNAEDIYRMADNFTSEVKIGDLPADFYNNSRFNVKSPNCENKMFDYCSRKNTFRTVSCAGEEMIISRFIQIHEDVAKLKHLLIAGKEVNEEENGFLFREGPRDSVIYEVVESLSSLIAIRPKNLKTQKLLPESGLPNEEIFSLLISALHIIPSLPYYLAADLWRINALKEMDATAGESTYESSTSTTPLYSSPFASSTENYDSSHFEKRDVSEEEEMEDVKGNEEENIETYEAENATSKEITNYSESTPIPTSSHATPSTAATPKIYDFENLTMDWWKYREQLQGVGNSDGKLYPDFLMDEKIIWNKPYVSKFLGKIVQFQILEYFRRENSTTNTVKIQTLLRKGKSKPFQDILLEVFDIAEISTKPLRKYFKPLEEFLDAGGNFQTKTAESDSDDFNLFSESYSMNSSPGELDETQQGSNTIAFVLIIFTALGIIAVSLIVALRRYRRNQRAKERRKRLNQAIN